MKKTFSAALAITGVLLAGALQAGERSITMTVQERMKEAARTMTTGDLLLTGTATQNGNSGAWSLRISADGRFVRTIDGPLGDANGFDGKGGWMVDQTGMPMQIEMLDLETAQLEAWLLTGAWLDRPGLIEVLSESGPDAAGDVTLTVRTRTGPVPRVLIVDGTTWLPKRLVSSGMAGEETWTYEDWMDINGRRYPRRHERHAGGAVQSSVEVADVQKAPGSSDFGMPTRYPADITFAGAGDTVAVRRAPTGHVLVHPRVNGQDVGWFILDTGAGQSVISTASAPRLGLEKVGETLVSSIFGLATGAIHRGERLELGPVTLARPLFVEMDLSPLAQYFGEEVGGIIGYDVLSRCVVEVDLARSRIGFRDPVSFDGAGLPWTALHLNQRHPVVPASFEGGSGLFRLDVGASGGSHGNVVFHAPAVHRLGLTEGRDTTPLNLAQQEAAEGRIAWFELAGKRWENPHVMFALGEDGPLSDSWTLGNIGNGFMRSFRIVFDYRRARIAFVPNEGAPE